MSTLALIADHSLWLFGGMLLAALMAAFEGGFWLARRRRAQAAKSENVGVVVGGLLGLFTFVLALTLSFGNTRFDERRMGALAEANAIGTAWLRAEALGGPRGEEIGRLLEDYLRLRAEFARAGRDELVVERVNLQTNALQNQIWGHLSAMIRDQPNPATTALMTALNDCFDAGTNERFAFRMRLPPQMFWLLLALAVLSTAALGFQLGVKQEPQRLLTLLLLAMWSAVMVNILDMASPRVGNFRADTSVYDWTLQSFKGGIVIPPAPAH